MKEMEFEVLSLENVEIQKAHIELKKRNEKIGKVQETLHIVVQSVY